MDVQLVENPAHGVVFLPPLLPGVERVSQEVSDPECRSVAATAVQTLLQKQTEHAAQTADLSAVMQDRTAVHSVIVAVVGAVLAGGELVGLAKVAAEYVCDLCNQLVVARNFEATEWEQVCPACTCLIALS